MLIGINQWHATTGLFWNDKHHSDKKDLNHFQNLNSRFVFIIALLLITHGDIETIIQDQKVKPLNIFHAVTGMLTVFLHMINNLY